MESTKQKLSSMKLAVGEEVWGYSANPHTVLNTEYQEYTSIKRTDTRRYEVSCGGRADGTGWREYCGTFKKAIELSKFNPNATVEGHKITTTKDTP